MIVPAKSNNLFIGPFVGEFGHELFSWQAHMREYAKDFDHVIASSRHEYKLLYEDFCDEFLVFDPGTYNSSHFSVLENKNEVRELFEALYTKYNKSLEYNVISPNIDNNVTIFSQLKAMPVDYKKFGRKDASLEYDIVIHPRSFSQFRGPMVEQKQSRDWAPHKWTELVDRLQQKGYKIASVGLSTSVFYVEGTDNLTDIPLCKLADVLCSSRCIVGASSGPLHFAALCNCKQVVWSDSSNKQRYLKDWNPFGVDVVFHDSDGWGPCVDKVMELIAKIL